MKTKLNAYQYQTFLRSYIEERNLKADLVDILHGQENDVNYSLIALEEIEEDRYA